MEAIRRQLGEGEKGLSLVQDLNNKNNNGGGSVVAVAVAVAGTNGVQNKQLNDLVCP